jgi:hypothetical protein
VNGELEKTEKEAVVAKFAVLSQHLSGETEENMKTSVGIASDPADVRTGHLPYTRQKLYRWRREGTNWKGRKNEVEFNDVDFNLSGRASGPVAGSCELGIEPSHSTKSGRIVATWEAVGLSSIGLVEGRFTVPGSEPWSRLDIRSAGNELPAAEFVVSGVRTSYPQHARSSPQ